VANRLDGKVAVITGGASGMGEATAKLFVAEGARIVIGDLQGERARAVAAGIGPECLAVEGDVSRSEDVQALVRSAVERFGKLDIMFNNAGIGGGEGKLGETSEEYFDQVLAVDLKGVWLGMRHALPHLIRNGGGSIISTASVAGLQGGENWGAYSAAKAGVIMLTRVCAVEYAEQGVRVNCICPGVIVTPLAYANPHRPAIEPATMRALAATMQPIPRAGEPEDVARTALWLASDESSFVTGQAIAVDGGLTGPRHTPSSEAQERLRQAGIIRD
jgi:NAD(P)-dependent dehydrogenase (short-subunit alcohol dehydrogenase family)